MTSGAERVGGTQLPELTSLRFFAALAVVLHHVAEMTGQTPFMAFCDAFGWLGVTFFFVLSGFVLMWAFDPQITAAQFLIRRLTRVYPLHLFTLLCALMLYRIYHTPIGGYRGTEAGTLASALLVHDWIPLHPEIRQAWNGVSWSLSAEFFFYICAPILLPVVAARSGMVFAKTALLLWLGLGTLICVAYAHGWAAILDFCLYHPVPRFFEFFLGALGARWLQQGFQPPPLSLALLVMIAPVTFYYNVAGAGHTCSDLMNLLFIPGSLLLILAVAASSRAGGIKILRSPWLVTLGEASFALYMVHALLLGVFVHTVLARMVSEYHATQPELSDSNLLYVAAAIMLSIAVHFWVESPARRLLMRRVMAPVFAEAR